MHQVSPLHLLMNLPTASHRRQFINVWGTSWRIGLFYIAWATLLAPFFILATTQLKAWEQARSLWARTYPDSVGLVCLLLTTWIMTRFLDRRTFASIGLASSRAVRNFLLGLGIGTIWLVVSLLIAWVAGWLRPQASGTVTLSYLTGATLSLFLNVATQQLLLCGYVWQTIQSRHGFRSALISSVMLFSAYHAGAFHGAWLPALNVLAAGTVFGLCYHLSGSLWLPIGCHFAWNFLLGQVFGLTVSGSNHFSGGWQLFSLSKNLFTGGAFGFEGGLLVCATTILCAGVLALKIQWSDETRFP